MRLGKSVRRFAATLIVLACLLAIPFGVSRAYVNQNPYNVRLDGPSGTVSCDADVPITATVRFAETGNLVEGQFVLWDFKSSRSSGDRVSPTRTITNSQGQTTVHVTFGEAEGERTVRATIATWPATIDVTCAGGVVTPRPTATATSRPTATATSTRNPDATPTAPPGGATASPSGISSLSPGASATGDLPGSSALPAQLSPGASTGVPGVTPTPGEPGGSGTGGTATPLPGGVTAAPGAGPQEPGAQPPAAAADTTLIAIVALFGIGAGLLALGFVFVRRR